MKIKRIGFGYTKNLGNYENCKLWLEADLEDWENPSESLEVLRNRAAQELGFPDEWHNLKDKIAQQVAALESIASAVESEKAKLVKAEQAWRNFAEFLTAHGVEPDTLSIENFAATRVDHSPTHRAQYVADDSAELGFGELDTSDDDCEYSYGAINEDDDDY